MADLDSAASPAQPPDPATVSRGTPGGEATGPTCYRCDTPLAEGSQVCPSCGRKQYRTCFCGTPVRVDLDRCPVCDADWSSKVKIRRRSRSPHVRPRTLARSALIGALVTVMAAATLNIVISAMAERSIPVGTTAVSFGARLYYAWCTLAVAFDTLFTRLLGGLGAVLITAIAGAAIGTMFYLLRAGYWRSRKHRSTHQPNRRRRSR